MDCSVLINFIPSTNTVPVPESKQLFQNPLLKYPVCKNPYWSNRQNSSFYCQSLASGAINERDDVGLPARYNWVDTNSNLSEEQIEAISKLPFKMTNRSKALMKQIICFSPENGSVPLMLTAWVKSTKPRRTDWLMVLKELNRLNHPLYLEVAEYALTEETFEANLRDYTKIIDFYGQHNQLQEAERTLESMKRNGFICDQVILTSLIHMYSKNENLKQAEASFEEMKMLGVPLDRRSYGAMIMAYIRAGKLSNGEALLQEMEALEIYAGREVYKALLRAYSMKGDGRGAQRVFDAIQVGGIIPDAKICGLLINAFVESGQTRQACTAFQNMRRAGVEPNAKCVALVLSAYEKENQLSEALALLAELEEDGFGSIIGEEAAHLLVKWFGKVGVLEEVGHVLRDLCRVS